MGLFYISRTIYLFVLAVFAGLFLTVFWNLSFDFSFLLSAPADFGRAGGIAPMLLSTIWVVLISILIEIHF